MPQNEQDKKGAAVKLVQVRIKLTDDVIEALKALESAAGPIVISPGQAMNALVVRGARACLCDLELGGNLPLTDREE